MCELVAKCLLLVSHETLTLVTPSLGETNPFATVARMAMGQIIDRVSILFLCLLFVVCHVVVVCELD